VHWYWWFAVPAILLAVLSLRGERRRAAFVARRLAQPPAYSPPATVIVPVKGPDHELAENLHALATLDYPDYELIVTAHSAADIPPGVLPARTRLVLAHGSDPATSEKIQNLQAAVRVARQRSQVLAFADSDGRVPRGWLLALVAPLAEPGVGASTGFRWFAPARPWFWSLLRSVWDSVSAGTLGPGDNRFAWGGAMAVRKQVFYETRVNEHWKGAVNDDYSLAAAIHEAKLAVAYAPGALVPDSSRTSPLALFLWARRQLAMTRFYQPELWRKALLGHVVYCAGMAACVAGLAAGSWPAALLLAAQLAPGMAKAFRRASGAAAALPGIAPRRWAHAALSPFATWLWLAVLAASAATRTIHWRGRRYYLKRP
jgi:ceramide glucosyltransferase